MTNQERGKQRSCRKCKEVIYSFQRRYKAREGYYCYYDGRIKYLHDGVMNWIRINFVKI
jgi:hypothetical protein